MTFSRVKIKACVVLNDTWNQLPVQLASTQAFRPTLFNTSGPFGLPPVSFGPTASNFDSSSPLETGRPIRYLYPVY